MNQDNQRITHDEHDGYGNFRHQPQQTDTVEAERTLPTGLNVRKKSSLKTVMFGAAGLAVSAFIVFSLMSWAGGSDAEEAPKNDLLSGSTGGKSFKREQEELLENETLAATDAEDTETLEGTLPPGTAAPMPEQETVQPQAASDPAAAIRARRLGGNVLLDAGSSSSNSSNSQSENRQTSADGSSVLAADSGSQNGNALTGRLNSGIYQAGRAQRQGSRDYLLARGTAIPCVTLTKIATDYPGLTRCQVTKDVYSANGSTVLIARGSTITGEQTAALVRGQSRIFALWSDLRTPDGLVVRLDSPGADPLGASGHPARIDHHFWQRIGGAVMISLIDDMVNIYGNRINNSQNTTVTFENTSESVQDLAGEILRNHINIPPTGYVDQGTEIMVFAARDIEFADVYENIRIQPGFP